MITFRKKVSVVGIIYSKVKTNINIYYKLKTSLKHCLITELPRSK